MTAAVRPPDLAGYAHVRLLGVGGFAQVHLYERQQPRMPVAVKVLDSDNVTQQQRDAFRAEADAMARLEEHPYIVRVEDVREATGGRPCLIMRFYSGPNLGERSRGRPLPLEEVLRVGVQMSSAVETAHRSGLLHRDIKPANILTDSYGSPGLTDFGVAARIGAEHEAGDALSIPWAAPEVVYGTASASPRSDVYSLGATIWHLLVGRSPFEMPGGDNRTAALMRRIRESARPVTGRPDVPRSLERLLARAMAVAPEQRPPTALDLAWGLQAVEQELQFPRTRTVVPDAAARPESAGSLDDGTAARAPLRIDAQPPLMDRGPGSGVRSSRAPAATALADPRGQVDVAPSAERTSSRRLTVLAVLTVLVAAAAAGVVLARLGGQPPAVHGDSSSASDDALPALPAPGTPAVTAVRSPGGVTYQWTYANPATSDGFKWRSADGSRQGSTGTAGLTLPTAAGSAQCLDVLVVRADGSASNWSADACPP